MAHIHEKIDFTTSVYVVYKNKVLLHLHKKLGKWLAPGGHVELDEDPSTAAIREIKEEAGLDVEIIGNAPLAPQPTDGSKDLPTPKFLNRHRFNDTHEHIDFVYFARARSADFAPEDGVEMRWVSREEIEGGALPLLDAVRNHALAALKELSM